VAGRAKVLRTMLVAPCWRAAGRGEGSAMASSDRLRNDVLTPWAAELLAMRGRNVDTLAEKLRRRRGTPDRRSVPRPAVSTRPDGAADALLWTAWSGAALALVVISVGPASRSTEAMRPSLARRPSSPTV
jgi:hypothetical protein